ncbi:hypothetical protein MARA_02510 (plasmid) [Mycolicibacterium arabiense]|uniref:Uncharacterized protein n=1 Tax=Mycolicibacterium arabiense TaxID=1286181 RepID=A0A7I7RRJ1_9MYCO|nr:hypothetical protein MARA_02510 [Mycolicibacterium arabiense]
MRFTVATLAPFAPTVRLCFVTVTQCMWRQLSTDCQVPACTWPRSEGFIPRVLQRGDASLLRAEEAVLKVMVDGSRAQMLAQATRIPENYPAQFNESYVACVAMEGKGTWDLQTM